MGVINMGKDVFTSIGSISKKIAVELGQDQQLCRLLKDTSINPLDKNKPDWDYISNPLLHKNILIVPKVDISELTESKVVINIPYSGLDADNGDFVNITFGIDVFTKLDQWIIENEDDVLRPFKIMERIKKKIHKKRLSSIGIIKFSTFELEILDDDVACHHMIFYTDDNE